MELFLICQWSYMRLICGDFKFSKKAPRNKCNLSIKKFTVIFQMKRWRYIWVPLEMESRPVLHALA